MSAVKEVDLPETEYVRPPKPSFQRAIRTFKNLITHIVGCDIYLESTLSPLSLADDMIRLAADTPFKLTLISNRGTQVWPTGSVYTECVDYYRVRFEVKDTVAPGSLGQSRCIALLEKISESYQVCEYDLLRTFDGVKGYSLAQGQ